MINFDTLYELVKISFITGSIGTLFVQKIKCNTWLKNDCVVVFISFFISVILGTFFTLSFTEFPFKYAIWVGVFSFVEAEALFNILKKTLNLKTYKENLLEKSENEDESKTEEKIIEENDDWGDELGNG